MNNTNVMDWRTYTIDPEGEVILALINDDGPFAVWDELLVPENPPEEDLTSRIGFNSNCLESQDLALLGNNTLEGEISSKDRRKK